MESPLVVYIIGDNRSGSTLLDYLLSCHPKAVSGGEIHHLHGFYYNIGVGKMYDWKCSCGNPIKKCVFWKNILNEINFNEEFKTKLEISSPKMTFLDLFKPSSSISNVLENQDAATRGMIMAENRWKIYKAINKQTEQQIIIDSSKDPFEAFFLNKYRLGNIKFLLIERDIRAISYSKMKRQKELQLYYNLKEKSIYKHIISSYNKLRKNIIISNIISETSVQPLVKKIKYENLVRNPQSEISEICSFLNIDNFSVPLITNQNNNIEHILCGSPSRYSQSPIRPDKRWVKFFKKRPVAYNLGKFFNNCSSYL